MNLIVEQIRESQIVHNDSDLVRQSAISNRVFVKIDQVPLIDLRDLQTELLKAIPEFFNEERGPVKTEVGDFETFTKRMRYIILDSNYEGDYSNLIRINLLRLRKEHKDLFWNLVYYFSFHQYNFTFLLPYVDDFKSKQRRKKSF